MTNGYLSKDRPYLNEQQRARRKRLLRVDYLPSKEAMAILESKRSQHRPGSAEATNSAALDSILIHWARLTGIKYGEVQARMTSAHQQGKCDQYARAYDFGGFNAKQPAQKPAATCGARAKSGHPCRSKGLRPNGRCKWHGGCSTGPTTAVGKQRALANLKQFAVRDP